MEIYVGVNGISNYVEKLEFSQKKRLRNLKKALIATGSDKILRIVQSAIKQFTKYSSKIE